MKALHINIIFARHSCRYEQARLRLRDRLLVNEILCIFPYSVAIRIENALENAIHARQTAPAHVYHSVSEDLSLVYVKTRERLFITFDTP